MEPDWKVVYTVNKPYQAEIIKDLLEKNGITTVIMNKRDSTYLAFGEIEIYVQEEFATEARKLLEQTEL
ncbi:MAG: DUF2007 domain-containing protein [Bacteroidales bacterium]|nr:DUF2007 domain-containing protein [Bacteroidales bacterium]